MLSHEFCISLFEDTKITFLITPGMNELRICNGHETVYVNAITFIITDGTSSRALVWLLLHTIVLAIKFSSKIPKSELNPLYLLTKAKLYMHVVLAKEILNPAYTADGGLSKDWKGYRNKTALYSKRLYQTPLDFEVIPNTTN